MAPVRTKRILVVEDYPSLARLTTRMIELMGHTASVAATVAEASNADTDDLDLVLCDYSLPDGDAVMVRKALQPRTDAKFVILSAYTADQCPADHGFDGYLTKPVDAEQLSQLIQRLCP